MKLNTDRIVSLSAMVVGVGSLCMIVYQTQLTRRAQHASVNADPYDFNIGLRADTNGFGDLLHIFEIAEVPRSWYVRSGAVEKDKAVIEIVYHTIYGDRWRIRSDRMTPKQL